MKVTHTFELEAKCPSIPGHIDRYTCAITTNGLIKVEDIRPWIEPLLALPRFQEELAADIAALLARRGHLNCGVRLEGQHPGGFKTVVEVE
jgi:hypothetical protein